MTHTEQGKQDWVDTIVRLGESRRKVIDARTREGATPLVFCSAPNRDGAQFERPDELVLERPRRHVAFGRGFHQCVGSPLPRLEGKSVLTELLKRTRRIELDPDDPPVWVENLLVRGHARLAIHVVPD